jgi:enediyne polyketide synthase
VCLRSEETDFVVDHFRARCRVEGSSGGDTARLALSPARRDCLALDPQQDLYGRILFHEGRFRRLRGYQLLKARECVAEIVPDPGATWFGPYLPADFALGDPAARDAALHAIQACVPHRRILPTGFDELVILRTEPGPRFVRARERIRVGNDFTYDVEVTDGNGSVVERWQGLHLRAVEEIPAREPWPEVLLAPYLERRLEELAAHAGVAVALERGVHDGRGLPTDEVIQQALGRTERVWRRPDGKPVRLESGGVSAAHCGEFTLAVAAAGGVACDLEEVAARAAGAWRDLLGDERAQLAERIARQQSESLDRAATRLWTAAECLKKIGQPADGPLVLEGESPDGWVWFRAGALSIATCPVEVRGRGVMVAGVAFAAAEDRGQEVATAREVVSPAPSI